jgi:hypothetical protein
VYLDANPNPFTLDYHVNQFCNKLSKSLHCHTNRVKNLCLDGSLHTQPPSDILTRTERPLNILSTVTLVHCNILTPVHNIQIFYVQPPLKSDDMLLVTSCPPSATWIVTFSNHFLVVLWVELLQLTWNFLDMSFVTFRLMNNQTYVHNIHHLYYVH